MFAIVRRRPLLSSWWLIDCVSCHELGLCGLDLWRRQVVGRCSARGFRYLRFWGGSLVFGEQLWLSIRMRRWWPVEVGVFGVCFDIAVLLGVESWLAQNFKFKGFRCLYGYSQGLGGFVISVLWRCFRK